MSWPAFLVGWGCGLASAIAALVLLDRLVMARLSAGELYRQAHGEREPLEDREP